jgi:hypothetical protein
MARRRRSFAIGIPVLLSGLCAVGTGCQCSFSCAPTWHGPNSGPTSCGDGSCYGGQKCDGAPEGAGQWAQVGHDASHQSGQWGQGGNSPPIRGDGPLPMYPKTYQGAPPQQQQIPSNTQLGPTPTPDRLPNVQSNNMNVPYSWTPTNGAYMQGGGAQMQTPFSQGTQGVPFGPTPMMQQGVPTMEGPAPRPARQNGNENSLAVSPFMPTEAPYSP